LVGASAAKEETGEGLLREVEDDTSFRKRSSGKIKISGKEGFPHHLSKKKELRGDTSSNAVPRSPRRGGRLDKDSHSYFSGKKEVIRGEKNVFLDIRRRLEGGRKTKKGNVHYYFSKVGERAPSVQQQPEKGKAELGPDKMRKGTNGKPRKGKFRKKGIIKGKKGDSYRRKHLIFM